MYLSSCFKTLSESKLAKLRKSLACLISRHCRGRGVRVGSREKGKKKKRETFSRFVPTPPHNCDLVCVPQRID